jgi:broad specificity phosphatase PhoE
MTSRLILICHGSTDAVRKAAFPADEPLDSHGHKAAATLAPHLPAVERCWTSPELRARQTAEALQRDALTLPELCDCDYGSWRGRTFADVLAQEPAAIAAWLRDPAAVPHGGESLMSLAQRVARWLGGQQGTDGRILVVTHATIIRAAIVHAIEAPMQSFWRIDVAPLSITCLSGIGGRWNLASAGCATL